MFTDIVGYTKLMGEDEQRAFELLDENREIQRSLIEKCNGKWLTIGVKIGVTTFLER